MKLNSISILNYKNIGEATLTFSPKVNCLIGNNGMGKTNILDAIYYLSFCKSSTGQTDASVITHDADFMMLQGTRATMPTKMCRWVCSVESGKRCAVAARSTSD